MKISIIGAGFVGKATAYMAMLNAHNLGNETQFVIHDINQDVLDSLTAKNELNGLDLSSVSVTLNLRDVYDSDIVFICINTNPLPNGKLDCLGITKLIDDLIEKVDKIVVRSTIDADFFRDLTASNVYYLPEFLREATPYADALSPSRIVVGAVGDSTVITNSLGYGSHPNVIRCNRSEAVAIKLFSNAYLAMRVAFFNEVEDYCVTSGSLNVDSVISGITSDDRIGSKYCTPSVAFGGYCLPKDTSTLQKETQSVLLAAVLQSNTDRIEKIARRYALTENLAIVDYVASTFKEISVADLLITELLKENPVITIWVPSPCSIQSDRVQVCQSFPDYSLKVSIKEI